MSRSTYEQLLMRIGEGTPEPRLSAMRRVTELMGEPQSSAPVVHITGTNGKTSVSRMVEALIRAHGLSTGLFVSPHLEKFNERILLNGVPADDATLDFAWEDVEPILTLVDAELATRNEPRVTFFEAMTALGLNVFANAPVDVIILEVGMGGEWDATNVADANVAVFSPIDLDHMKQLGNTIGEIARTKSGIMKPLSVAVSAQQHREAETELISAAQRLNIQLFCEGNEFSLIQATPAVGGQVISVQGRLGVYEELPLPLHGRHQAENAALAIAAVEALLADNTPLNVEILVEGLSSVTSPGRFERVSQHPLIFIDAAHNPHGASALVRTVEETFPERDCAILLGVLDDKDASAMARKLSALTKKFFLVQPSGDRGLATESLAAAVRSASPEADITECASAKDAIVKLGDWTASSERRLAIITGSVAMIGEVQSVMRQDKRSDQ